ncbi:hypothetical protein FI667_g10016, partial [Globisporangium splendens]
MRRQQQQQQQSARRLEFASPAQLAPRTPRRRPEWNGYLTDISQYKLNEQQQLQKQLQQLSTAHFSSRSPAHLNTSLYGTRQQRYVRAMSPAPPPASIRSRMTTPARRGHDGNPSIGAATPVNSVSATRPSSNESVRRRGPIVSFKLDHEDEKLDQVQKANLQGELAVLERMLYDLETETEHLQREEYGPDVAAQGSPHQRHRAALNHEEYRDIDDGENEEEDGNDIDGDDEEPFDGGNENATEDASPQRRHEPFASEEQGDSYDHEYMTNDRLSEVCYKSLHIGLHLATKMDQLTKELEAERNLRMDHELKIDVLEQEVRSTRAKCNYLDAKYQSVTSQMDEMPIDGNQSHERRRSKSTQPSKSPKHSSDTNNSANAQENDANIGSHNSHRI